MIRLFDKTETSFDHNKNVLKQVLSATVIEEANGQYELELEIARGEQAKLINEESILVAPTSDGDQPFRVYKRFKTLKGAKVYAKHIFYDLRDNFLEDVRPTNQTGVGALSAIMNGTQHANPFTASSDITALNTSYYVRQNPVQAIMGSDETSFLRRWGGELKRDKYEIRINAHQGQNRGYTIRLGKNLIGIEEDLDMSEVVTRLYPTVVLDDNQVYSLPEKYVDSALLSKYSRPYIREVRVSLADDQKGTQLEDIYTLMRNHCAELYAGGIDLPRVNYKVDFVQLQAKHIAEWPDEHQEISIGLLAQLELYDTVNVRVDELDIEVSTKVIRTEYDSLKNRFLGLELGSFKPTLANQRQEVTHAIDKAIKDLEETTLAAKIREVTNLITGASGGYVITRFNSAGQPYELLIMDNVAIDEAVKVWRWNVNGLGYSSSGYNGPFATAITASGEIVADFVATGTLNANLIKAGMLQSFNGVSWLNMENGTFNFGNKVVFNGSSFSINYDGTQLEQDIADAEERAKDFAEQEYLSLQGALNGYVSDLQDQIDGKIYTWFENGVPTLSNIPASHWTTEAEHTNHVGDLYYDGLTGKAYRFTYKDNDFLWVAISDNDIAAAMALAEDAKGDASDASNLAGTKRRVFTATPFPPYEVGDLWVQGTGGDLMRCQTTRLTGSYLASHWVKAVKYTDDTRAVQAEDNAISHTNTKFEVLEGQINLRATKTEFEDLEERVSDAELLITPEAITSTVESNTTTLATKSEVTQVDDAWTAAFSEMSIGGRNLIITAALTLNQGMNASGTLYSSGVFAVTDFIPVEPGEKFVISGYTTLDSIAATCFYNANKAYISGVSGLDRKMVVAPSNAAFMRSAVLMDDLGKVKLERGTKATDWSPAPEELYTGVTRIDRDGINVSESTSDINTQLSNVGLEVRSGTDTVASFGDVGAHMPHATIETIESSSVIGVAQGGVYDVGVGYAYSNVGQVLDVVFGGNKRYLLSNLTIRIRTNISENILIEGIFGADINIVFQTASVRLSGYIEVKGCASNVSIYGANSANASWGTIINNSSTPIQVTNSRYVYVYYMNLGGSSTYAATVINGSGAEFAFVDFGSGRVASLRITNNSSVTARSNRGNASYAIQMVNGGLAKVAGTHTAAGQVNFHSTNGFVLSTGTSPLASAFSPPPVTTEQFVQTFAQTGVYTLQGITGSTKNTYFGNTGAQNRWSTATPQNRGAFEYGSAPHSFYNGGTSISGRIRFRRANTTHGISGAVQPRLWKINGTEVTLTGTGALRGGWSGWITIPFFTTRFPSGGALLELYRATGETGGDTYAVWDRAELEVTVTKTI